MNLSRNLSLYEKATVADLEPPLNDWDFSGGRGLLLYGDPGVGKTYAAYALWRQFCNHPTDCAFPIMSGRVAPFLSVAQYIRETKAAFDLKPEAKPTPIKWEQSVRFAVFDDFDKARLTDWAREEMFAIIDTLYTRQIPVVITSNCPTPKAFINHVGPYIGDRIKAMCVPHPMKGQSRRRSPQP